MSRISTPPPLDADLRNGITQQTPSYDPEPSPAKES